MKKLEKDDYIKYRIQKAKGTLSEVKLHIENRLWNTAINRLYYACYYAVGALLIKHEVDTASHSGARQKFGQLFVKTNKIEKKFGKHFSILFEKRHKGDYSDFYDCDETTVKDLFPISSEFIKKIEELLSEGQ